MSVIKEENGVRYSVMQDADVQEVAMLHAKVFFKYEALVRALPVTREEVEIWSVIGCRKGVGDSISVIARDIKFGAVVGYCVNWDFYSREIPDGDKVSPKFGPVYIMLDSMDEQYMKEYPGELGEVFLQAFSGVDYDFYKDKSTDRDAIALTLYQLSMSHSKNKGFKRCVAQCTTTFSTQAYRLKLGFTPLYKVLYKEYVFEGEKPFSGIRGHRGCTFMEKYL